MFAQEMSDRDYALKLSNELNASPRPQQQQQQQTAGVAAIPQLAQYAQYPAPQPSASPHQVPGQPAATAANSAMVYGTPVSGPPPNLVPVQGQQQAQPAWPSQGYMSTLPAAVPGGPSTSPQPQYQQYGTPAGVAPPAQNPGYNPYGPAAAPVPAPQPPAPVNHYAQQGSPAVYQQQQQQAGGYGAYPALPAMAGQPAPAAYPAAQHPGAIPQQGGYQYNTTSYNTVPGPIAQPSEFDQKVCVSNSFSLVSIYLINFPSDIVYRPCAYARWVSPWPSAVPL